MDTNPTQHDDGDERLAGDLLVGADKIRAYLVFARHARGRNRRSVLLEAERQAGRSATPPLAEED